MRCGALQVRGSLDASGAGGESRSKSPRRTSCFLEVPTDPMFRSRSRSLDDGTRARVPPSDCEATYRIFDEIVKEGKTVFCLSRPSDDILTFKIGVRGPEHALHSLLVQPCFPVAMITAYERSRGARHVS